MVERVMKSIAFLLLLICSLKCFSIEKVDCPDTSDSFIFSKKSLNNQLHTEVNVTISKEINTLLTTGLENFHDKKYKSGYSSFEKALRMMRGNYGLYSPTQIKALVPLMELTLSEKDFSRYYKYQNIFNNLILRSKEIHPVHKIQYSIWSALSNLNLAFYDESTAPYQNLLQADETLGNILEQTIITICPKIVAEALWLRSAITFAIEQHFLLWKGEPIFGIEEEKIYSDRQTDPIEKLSRKNSILNFRMLGESYLKEAIDLLKKENANNLLQITLRIKADWHLLHGNYRKFKEYTNQSNNIGLDQTTNLYEFSYFKLLNHFQSKPVNFHITCQISLQKNGKVKSSRPIEGIGGTKKINRLVCRKLKSVVFRPDGAGSETTNLKVGFDKEKNKNVFEKPIFIWATIKSERNIHPIWAGR